MPIVPNRPRQGRLLDWLAIGLFAFVFFGLAFYHYRRLDRSQTDPERQRALAEVNFEGTTPIETKENPFDWPQFRGPNRDGVCTETDILTTWPENGPKVLWEQKTGEGFASVVVVRGRVFTILQDDAYEAVVAWNAETGKELWRFRYPCRYENSYGNGPRSTPSVEGEFIYTVGATGIMHCLKAFTDDPAGALVWRRDLVEEFKAPIPKWGVAFAPLVEKGKVYVMPGGPNGKSIAALDARTGDSVWTKFDDLPSYSSPIAATIHGHRQVLFLTGKRLISVHPDTGEMLWDYPWEVQLQCNIAMPMVETNYVFLSSFYGKGCVMIEVAKDEATWKANFVYENDLMQNHIATSVRYNNHLYGFDDKTLKCLDFRTGKEQWKKRGFDKGSVLLVRGHLVIYGANGILALAEANPKAYVEKARFEFSDQKRSCWSVPVISNGRLYVRDERRLVCFDVKEKKNEVSRNFLRPSTAFR